MEISNQTRGYSYMLGVLKNQESDPYCHSCNSFVSTLAAVKENLGQFEREHAANIGTLSAELSALYAAAKNGITEIQQPVNPVGQKKSGNCKLPEGVCFLKSTLSLLQKL